jgi:hypothetical protein
MKAKVILAAACFAGAAGIAQAGTIPSPVTAPVYSGTAPQAGHLMKVARVLLGYDQFGRPVYGHRRLPRQIIGYDQYGRPIYGYVYNNQPLFLTPGAINRIFRPYNPGWNWGHRHWEHRDRHEQGDHQHRDHERGEHGHH